MKYYDVVKDIIKYYSDVVNNYELETLNRILYIVKDKENNEVSDEIVYFINRILDRIWNLTLTDIKDFKNGEDFCFLVKEIDVKPMVLVSEYKEIPEDKEPKILSTNIIDGNKVDFVDFNTNEFKLINNKNIIDININDSGIIVSINYTNNLRTTPLLPIYFKDKLKINLNYDVISYYAIDTKLDEIDVVVTGTKEESIKNGLPLIVLDKSLYRENNNIGLISNDDLNEMLMVFILKYTKEKKDLIGKENKLRTLLIKNEKNKLKREIIKYYKKKITKEELVDFMNKIIESYSKDLTLERQK